MTKFGKTSAGRQRWRCSRCKISQVSSIDRKAKHLREFLAWLFSPARQVDMPGGGRSFRRRTKELWQLWPLPPIIDEIHRVVYLDGIHLGRKAVILIACTNTHILGWYLARSENSRAWAALMRRIAPPDVAVCDGASGFAKACRQVWPNTRVQRCLFHVYRQIIAGTTLRPRLPASCELLALGKRLLRIKTPDQARNWLTSWARWCHDYQDFLAEQTRLETGQWVYTHARVVKVRNSINSLIAKDLLFTFLDPQLTQHGPLPATNNQIEGGTNMPLRQMLRNHRGMSLSRRIKAVFWYCYQHLEAPLGLAELVATMPTDQDIAEIYNHLSGRDQRHGTIAQWGDAIVWSELHHTSPYRMDWD